MKMSWFAKGNVIDTCKLVFKTKYDLRKENREKDVEYILLILNIST